MKTTLLIMAAGIGSRFGEGIKQLEPVDNNNHMAGFVLKNTLSDNGSVTRGICKMDSDNNLTEIIETKNIIKRS